MIRITIALLFSFVVFKSVAVLQLPMLAYNINFAIVETDRSITIETPIGTTDQDGNFFSTNSEFSIPAAEIDALYRDQGSNPDSFVCGAIVGATSKGFPMLCEDGEIKLSVPENYGDDPNELIAGTCNGVITGSNLSACMAINKDLGPPENSDPKAICNATGQYLISWLRFGGPQTTVSGSFAPTTPCISGEEIPETPDPDPPIPADPRPEQDDLLDAVHSAAAGPDLTAFGDPTTQNPINNAIPAVASAVQAAQIFLSANYSTGQTSAPAGFTFETGAPTAFTIAGSPSEGGGGGSGPDTGGSGATVTVEGEGTGTVTVNVTTGDAVFDCAANPDILACQIIEEDIPLDFTVPANPFDGVPVEFDIPMDFSISPSSGSCPQPNAIQLGQIVLQVDLAPFCNGLVYISPVIKVLFALSALLILTGGMRGNA